jgi:archaemetzincin
MLPAGKHMKENLYPNLEELLAPPGQAPLAPLPAERRGGRAQRQSFQDYRRSRPARQTARRRAIYLSRVGELSAAQEAVVTATAEYLAVFFDLPVRPGTDFDPTTLRPQAIRQHPARGHPQLLTAYLLDEVLWLDRPEEALICLGVTSWDLCSDDHPAGQWGSVFGEAIYGHAGVWSLRHLGDPGRDDRAFRRCLKRSCAVATHEALHVLGLDHCADVPCNMRGSACLSGPLHLCPPCLRKLCWNRQLDLVPYLARVRDWLGSWGFTEAAEHYESLSQLAARHGKMG